MQKIKLYWKEFNDVSHACFQNWSPCHMRVDSTNWDYSRWKKYETELTWSKCTTRSKACHRCHDLTSFFVHVQNSITGDCWKLLKKGSRCDSRLYFSQRSVNRWTVCHKQKSMHHRSTHSRTFCREDEKQRWTFYVLDGPLVHHGCTNWI